MMSSTISMSMHAASYSYRFIFVIIPLWLLFITSLDTNYVAGQYTLSSQYTLNFVAPTGAAPWLPRQDGRIMQLVQPLNYTGWNTASQVVSGTIYPGSYVLVGGSAYSSGYPQPNDVWITSDLMNWILLSGGTTSGSPTTFPTFNGAQVCKHRNSFERAYYIGTTSWSTTGTYTVYASNNYVTWTNIIDSATNTAFQTRQGLNAGWEYTQCVVGMNDIVYSIGGSDTYLSTNLGVTFTPINSVNHFVQRLAFAAVIYWSPYYQKDIITIVGGAQGEYNDVSDIVTHECIHNINTIRYNTIPYNDRHVDM